MNLRDLMTNKEARYKRAQMLQRKKDTKSHMIPFTQNPKTGSSSIGLEVRLALILVGGGSERKRG